MALNGGEKPIVIVIVGATGDLAQKKLFPSLFGLYTKGLLPSGSSIIAFSRRPWTDADFRSYVAASFPGKKTHKKTFASFLRLISYHEGYFEDQGAFDRLIMRLQEIDIDLKTYTKKYIYLSVSPDSYGEILSRLGKAFSFKSISAKRLFTKILIEKPFGKSLASAKALEKVIRHSFAPVDILRVDHYLGKSALHYFTSLAGEIPAYFRKVWNKNHITSIKVKLFEKKGIEERNEFYDAVGAIRDVGQNHLLETLALVVTSPHASASVVQKKREAFLKSLVLKKAGLIRGQYKGYRDEVGSSTQTETYFKMQLASTRQEWVGVTFELEAGKAMPHTLAEVVVTMKHHSKPFTIRIQPKPELHIPSEDGKRMEKVVIDETFDAYEEIFLAAFKNDVSRFPNLGEIFSSWKLIDKVRAELTRTPLYIYAKGSHLKR